METQLPISLFTLLTATLLLPSPATARQIPTNADTAFIHSTCQKIQTYPDLCSHLLSRYATQIHQDPSKLATIAISLSLATTETMANYVSTIGNQADFGSDQRAAAAVQQCYSSFRDAMDSMHDSVALMRDLGSARSFESLRFKLSSVQTYMSSALTYEEDCLDVFEDVMDGKIKRLVRDKTQKLERVTSVALALVNSYVEKVTTTP
ncbi:hypothetical protein DCAR_0727057 [Daucus carota subsp. sativus]|uniref:Uncharacterized protein n=1 Tax=Daucus carota subsp. sativus TaxID=79200 RepID=A0A161X288_DAUCS|nr:PREDICTED: 21 kDa protein [Daucus carota subsp. sativus]WOH07624.1 hypothetical protein DCAR_0727057 [Daucus carota subsp. sativus]